MQRGNQRGVGDAWCCIGSALVFSSSHRRVDVSPKMKTVSRICR